MKKYSIRQITKFTTAGVAIALLGACDSSDRDTGSLQPSKLEVSGEQLADSLFTQGAANVDAASRRAVNGQKGAAKNVILFVGDGMGVSTVTAARILAGQQLGGTGEEHQLSLEKLPFAGLAKTYNTNQQTPDSAGTMTAMVTGVKTKAGVLSVAEDVIRSDCGSGKGKELTTLFDLAESAGKATGIVSTARITHATPAATYAKLPERNWEASAPTGCKDIADQLVGYAVGDGIDVVMGGGRRNFLPETTTDIEGSKGKRTDGRDLTAEWKSDHPAGVYVQTRAEFDGIGAGTGQVLGLFNASHMAYEADRKNDIAGEPSLSEMTGKALDILSQDQDGYVLMIEAGRIDHGHHAGSAYNALTDAVEFDKAVQVAMDKTGAEDTLIIVTADHGHVFTIAGYPTRGNPILGKVVSNDESGLTKSSPALAKDDLPYTTLGYLNGLGYANYADETNADARYADPANPGRFDLTNVDTTSPGFHQEALVPLNSETHAGEDVAIYARGPGAHLLTGTVEQNMIFHVMTHAGGLH